MILDELFYTWDLSILRLWHQFAEATGGFFTPFLYFVSLTGKAGVLGIAISLGLIVRRKTRRLGLVLALSILLGFLISNVGLKHIVARQRPYVTSQEVSLWWQSLGLRAERDLSFPSGHTTFASAFSTGFAVEKGKRWLPCAVLYTLLMAVSRNYLLFHYPTDVLAGILVGLIAGGLAYFIVHRAYAQAEKNGKDFAQ